MAGEILFPYTASKTSLYAVLLSRNPQMFNQVRDVVDDEWETLTSGQESNYDITLSEVGGSGASGLYSADLPTGVTVSHGPFVYWVFDRVGTGTTVTWPGDFYANAELLTFEKLRLSADMIEVGAAIAGTLSTTQMSTDLTEATNDHYNGRVCFWTSGSLIRQAAPVTDYDGTNKILTFSTRTEAPSAGDAFILV